MDKKKKCKMHGYILLAGMIASILSIMLAGAYFTVLGGSFGLIKNSKTALQAQQYAEIASNTLSLIMYDDLDSEGAHARRAIPEANGWEDEVMIGPEKIIGDDNRQRIATVRIYKTGDVLSRYSLQVPLSSQGSSIKKGMILAWFGSINAIPRGWALCDGSNGTPDLRDRFILGGGGRYSISSIGGEEMHTLTIAEMPSHNHRQYIEIWAEKGSQIGNGITSNGTDDLENVQYWQSEFTGGNQPHNNMPPYYTMAYIMKI